MTKSHNIDLPFRPRVVPRDEVDLRTAKFWKRGTGTGLTYHGRTTCPQCYAADIEGYNILVAHHGAGGPDGDSPADAAPPIDEEPGGPVEIPFECSCATEHQKDKTGCGAKWICIWKDEA